MQAESSVDSFECLIADAFQVAGFELYVVGGVLRDELLGLQHDDLDFATNARPEDIVGVLETIAELTIYRVGEQFGTIGAVLEGSRAEITTYRSSESYTEGSRKPDVKFGLSIEEDLSRRDFTVNAIARVAGPQLSGSKNRSSATVPFVGDLIDPCNGRDDLRRRNIRSVGDPDERFREDPLRLLRGVRFAAALDFTIDAATWESMLRSAPRLKRISRERIADELNRMLIGPAPTRAFTLLREGGLLRHSVPQLLDLDAIQDQGPHHAYSLWDHTFRVVESVGPDPISRWAALLHDVAKPETLSRDPDGRVRFFGHEDLGAEKAERILRSLRMSNETIDSVRSLVRSHMQVHQYNAEWSDGAVRRLAWKLGTNFDRAIDLALADAGGHSENPWNRSGVEQLARRAMAATEAVPSSVSPLDGEALMARYNRPPGRWIRTVKETLTDAVTEGTLRSDDIEVAWRIADVAEADTRQ